MFVDPGATAIDDVDGDITSNIVVTGLPVDTSTPNTFFAITYDVEDSAGNAAVTQTRNGVVLSDGLLECDFEPPVITVIGPVFKKNNLVRTHRVA